MMNVMVSGKLVTCDDMEVHMSTLAPVLINKEYGPMVFAQVRVTALQETCKWLIERQTINTGDWVEVARFPGQIDSEFSHIIGYDDWEDFAAILTDRGRIDVELIPEDERAAIVTSYPYGLYDANADDSDWVWQVSGGPWFDALEDLLAAKYSREMSPE